MPVASSGAFGLYDVNIVLHKSGTATISLNDGDVRTMSGQYGNPVYMNSLHGTTKAWAGTYILYYGGTAAGYYTGYYNS